MLEVAQTSIHALSIGLIFAFPPIINEFFGPIFFGSLALRAESFVAGRFELELLSSGPVRVALVALFELALLLSGTAAAIEDAVAIAISRLMKQKMRILIF